MITAIFPGFSPSNAVWAQECQTQLGGPEQNKVFEWKHWKTNNREDFTAFKEAEQVITKIGNAEFNILAKSIGTLVSMHVLHKLSLQAGHIILNGIPLVDLDQSDFAFYDCLSQIPAYKITVFQNETDPHGSFAQVKEFIDKITPNITVISTPRSDHDYPFFEEFKRLLK